MRAARWAAPVLAISACAAPAAAPRAAPAQQAEPVITATWEVERAVAGSPDVEIAYTVAACTVLKHTDVVEAADKVTITLDLGGREGKDCTEPVRKHRVVTLKAPLGERALYDGGVSPAALVSTETRR